MPPITRAEAERRALEEAGSAGSARPSGRGRPLGARPAPASRFSGSTATCSRAVHRASRRGSRGTPKTSVITAPIDDDQQRVDDQADEEDRDADGEAERPDASATARGRRRVAIRTVARSVPLRRLSCASSAGFLSNPAVAVAGNQLDAVLGPAAVDERADLRRSSRSPRGHGARALLRPLRGRVDAELAADELALGAWSSWSSGPSREHDVARRVDVRAGVEERPARSRGRRRGRRRRSRTSSGTAARAPRSRASPSRAWPGNALRIETMQQLWNAPATGRS